MSVEKKEILLKCCDCTSKTISQIHADTRKKHLRIISGVFFLLAVTSICFFVQYTIVRINDLEESIKKMDHSYKEALLAIQLRLNQDQQYSDPYYDFSDDDDEGEEDEYNDSEEYSDYDTQKHKVVVDEAVDHTYVPATNMTKDIKDDTAKPVYKRSVVAATRDGILINSESYAENKAKNLTNIEKQNIIGKSVTVLPGKSSTFGLPLPLQPLRHPSTEKDDVSTVRPTVSMRRSRVMHYKNDPSKAFRRIIKKPYLKSGDQYDNYSEETTTQIPIYSDSMKHRRLGRTRPLIAIHFSGDTSKYVYGKHDNFNGNGHLRHLQSNFIDWAPSKWVAKTGMDSHFSMNEGILTIKESGLYYVYAQIYYLDQHDMTGYRVYRNNQMILQCTITTASNSNTLKGNTCYTGGVEFLSKYDTIYLSDVTSGKYSLFEPGKSFFGLIKIGDFKNK